MHPPNHHPTIRNGIFFTQPRAGYLKVNGQDRLDFLQRQTTNDLALLEPGKILPTVLTSPSARILDVFYLFTEAESGRAQITSRIGSEDTLSGDTLHVITLPTLGERTVRYLQNRIFFMDKVTVNDASMELTQLDLFGPQAFQVLKDLGVAEPPQAEGIIFSEISGISMLIVGHNPRLGMGYRLIASIASAESLKNTLISAGANPLDDEGYATLRVEAGLPAANQELSEEFTPLETNLDSFISQSKGCYTGQEVIARQINYEKVTRHLVGLFLDQPVVANGQITSGTIPVGKVTSAVFSPDFGPIALAIIKRPFHQPGTLLNVSMGSSKVDAHVTSLPFN